MEIVFLSVINFEVSCTQGWLVTCERLFSPRFLLFYGTGPGTEGLTQVRQEHQPLLCCGLTFTHCTHTWMFIFYSVL